MRIAVDMDGVLADLLPQWLDLYNIIWKDSLEVEDITKWRVKEVVKEEAEPFLENMLRIPNFYFALPRIEYSVGILKELSLKHEIFIVTDPFVRESVPQKVDWLAKHYPFIDKRNILFTGNKSIVKSDILIDDNPDNLKGFDGYRILYDMPYNREYEEAIRVHNWLDIDKVVKEIEEVIS